MNGHDLSGGGFTSLKWVTPRARFRRIVGAQSISDSFAGIIAEFSAAATSSKPMWCRRMTEIKPANGHFDGKQGRLVFRLRLQIMAALLATVAFHPAATAQSEDQPARACATFFHRSMSVKHLMSAPNMELFQVPGRLTIQVGGDVSYSLSQDRTIGLAATVTGTGCKYTLTGVSASAFGGQPVFSTTGFLLPRGDEPQENETNYYITGPMSGSIEVEGVGYYPIGSPHFAVEQLSRRALKLTYAGQFQEFGSPREPRRIRYEAVLQAFPGR